MKYVKFSGKSWVFSTKDFSLYQRMMAIAGSNLTNEKVQALFEMLIIYAYENDLGDLRNAFYQSYLREK